MTALTESTSLPVERITHARGVIHEPTETPIEFVYRGFFAHSKRRAYTPSRT